MRQAALVMSQLSPALNKVTDNRGHMVMVSVIIFVPFVNFNLFALMILSHVTRKPVFGVSDKVRHKLGCRATENG